MSVISFNEFKSKYRFDCQLSQGSFGRVCRIQEIETKKYFALKKVAVKKKQQLEDIQNQIRLLSRFHHPFVVQIKETYNIQIKNGFAKPIWEVGLVMELAKCSLEHILRMKKTVGSFQFLIEQTAGLIKILFILQKQNIAHRDIKPGNILVFEQPDNSLHWKLADFGLSLDLNRSREEESFAGSFQYASPKLRRKFKYPNLKIKTNPFKDDVYSLGVTLLEVITGFRSYNEASHERLREVCPEPRLVNLVDIMLEEDQEKRPCFKQLMMLMEKDFKIQIQNVDQINKAELHTISKFRKLSSSDYRSQNNLSDKTVVKKHERNVNAKKTIFELKRPVQCLANLDGIIMCGCDNGEVVFVKEGQIVEGGPIHKRNVSQLFPDSKGNIWSVGGDNIIKKWPKNSLIKGLISQVKQVIVSEARLFQKPIEKTKLTINLQTYFEQINLPFNHVSGISCLFVIDADHVAVGYYDGYVFVRWDGGQYHGKFFNKPVTAIKIGNSSQKLWFCGLDGQVKILKTKQLVPQNRMFFKKGYNFIDLHLYQAEPEPCINLLTIDGRQLLLKPNLQQFFESSIQKSTVLSSVSNNDSCFMLLQNGLIIDENQEKIIDLGSKGWNCLAVSTEKQLIAGSFDGQIALVEW